MAIPASQSFISRPGEHRSDRHAYPWIRNLPAPLLGSVTAQVLHDSHCPVWTAAHAEEPGMRKHADFRSIMCAIDTAEKSLPLIRRAALMAGELNSTLHLVHAVPLFADPDVDASFDSANFFLDSARKQIESLQRMAGMKSGICIAGGSVSEVVRESALRHAADLILIGRGRLQERFGGLRSNTYSIIRDSPCPVLTW